MIVNTIHAAETIVLFRHAEKANEGLGQLSCQGLNRSLALPEVLLKKFGQPNAIFAPNPSVKKADHGIEYAYIRPLATVEPIAIRFGLPVNINWGLNDLKLLEQELISPKLKNSMVFVAWEHRLLGEIVKELLIELQSDSSAIPVWESDDFDGIYVVTITEDQNNHRNAVFRRDVEGLNNQSTLCPN